MIVEALAGGKNILVRQYELCRKAERVDIATYGVGAGPAAKDFLSYAPTPRVVVGGQGHDGIKAAMAFRSHMHQLWPKRPLTMRYVTDSHCKVFIAYEPKPVVIVGSMNLGGGMPYETAILIRGLVAKKFVLVFENLWRLAVPVNPLDMGQVARDLSSSVFSPKG